MMRSMYAAVAGLRTHQTRMDVIGDNIANVNTPGFKRGRATFQDIFYQTLRGGTMGSDVRGGTNPQQIGLGISLATIDVIHTQGAAQPTGKADDLMIQGDGFFVLKEDQGDEGAYFSRAGAFRFVPSDDGNDYLVNPANGLYVMNTAGDRISIPSTARSFNIDTMGFVSYIEGDTGQSVVLDDPIAIAKFPNPAGLLKVGENLYRYDFAAGDEPGGDNGAGGEAGTDGRGTIIPSTLEMSNVELAQEFTEMIVTQRGFQANARTITVSDEMLQELANLKR
ncbi:MAG TPA: flagellar hook-basal body complex protein [Clostridia bacterium]|nr:flagellar hook-basal body complex protein [Clostridia bacterium]